MAACKQTSVSMLSVVPIRETNVATETLIIIYFITLLDSAHRYRLPAQVIHHYSSCFQVCI